MSLPKPLNNYVLLRASVDNSKITFKNGEILWVDTSYTPNKFANVICEVMEVPDRLIFGKGKTGTMRHKTEMELRVGDTVIVSFLAITSAFSKREPMNFEIEGETYFFAHYEHCLVGLKKWKAHDTELFFKVNNPKTISYEELATHSLVLRGDEIYTVIPLNGMVICEPVEKEIKTSLIIPDSLRMRDKKMVICRFVGSPNTEYINDVYADSTEIKSGDVLIVDREADVPLEADTHRTLLGDKELWRIENHLVHGILQKETV